jgi:hypothetical protein
MGDIEDNLQQPRRARVGSSFVLDKSRSQALRWANVCMTVVSDISHLHILFDDLQSNWIA